MNKWLHLTLVTTVAGCVVYFGAWLVGTLWPDDDYIAIGLGILWGVVVGMAVVGYWEEVIDADAGRRRQQPASHLSRSGSEYKP